MKKILLLLFIVFAASCKNDKPLNKTKEAPIEPKPIYEYGFKLNDYKVINDTIKPGENFSDILLKNHIDYAKIIEIANTVRDTFNVRTIKAGVPYTILAKKDSTEKAQVFIYKPSLVRYSVINFQDSTVTASNKQKPIKTVIKTATGVINGSLVQTVNDNGLNLYLAYRLDDIFAWSIDFFRLQKNDKFKIIYEQYYINDTIPVGIGDVKAAMFEHGGNDYYAFKYTTDSIKHIADFYDEKANSLKRMFLKAPIKASRITSRFNLFRRIAYYGNKIRPHKGTDFAAPVGTPIMTTANGVVIESRFRGGNGNYVKIRHNSTYTTQYLHMSRRAVKVGQYVKQGDIIGYVGMTGNTSGPHVCYRFWKNGRQVDPLKLKLQSSDPLKQSLRPKYLAYIKPVKQEIDSLKYLTKK